MSNFALFATSVRHVTTLALLSKGIIRRPSLAHSLALFGPDTLIVNEKLENTLIS